MTETIKEVTITPVDNINDAGVLSQIDDSTSVLPTVASHIHDPLILATLASEVGLEEWRDIPGYEEEYQVSNLGRVRSKCRVSIMRNGVHRLIKSKTISSFKGDKYPRVTLCKDKERKRNYRIHILVLMAFAGPNPENMPIVRHILDDAHDARLCSVLYGTYKQNSEDADKNGKTQKGETHYRAKLTKSQVVSIKKQLRIKTPHRVIAKRFGISKTQIGRISQGVDWAHID